jgi:hypothetical protein
MAILLWQRRHAGRDQRLTEACAAPAPRPLPRLAVGRLGTSRKSRRRCAALSREGKAFLMKRCTTGAHRRRFSPQSVSPLCRSGRRSPYRRTGLPESLAIPHPSPDGQTRRRLSPWSTRWPPKPRQERPAQDTGAKAGGDKMWQSVLTDPDSRHDDTAVPKRPEPRLSILASA